MSKKQGKISISTQNLLPIIKKWLYSEHDIFLRELVSNSSDAIAKLKHLALLGEYKGTEPLYKIEIVIDKEKKTITIMDNGLGLDEEEIEKYISQVAFSGAQDFISKYEKVGESKDLIGFFGLGFYSAFMVAHTVEINSLSYKDGASAVFWKSDGNESFEIDSSTKTSIGTEITLYLNDDSLDFLEETTVTRTIKHYSQFLSTPIIVNTTPIENLKPLWRSSSNDVVEDEYNQLFQTLFPNKMTEPIFHFHIKTDYPFELNGIFYFPKINNQMDPNQGNIKLFVKDVFVGDGLKEIIPEYLSPLLGVIESPDIPLNVSRSQLQGDVRIRKIASYIETKFVEKIISLFKEDRKKLEDIWSNISVFIKFGCMKEDSFFKKIQDHLLFETTQNQFLTLKEYQEKYTNLPKNEGKTLLFYAERTKPLSTYKDILETHQIDALLIDSGFDSHFLSFLEGKDTTIKFTRVDSEENDLLYNKTSEISQEEKDKMVEIFKNLLNMDEIIIQANELKDISVPGVIVTNEQMRRFQEMSMMFQQSEISPNALIGKTLVINTANNIVQKVIALKDTKESEAKNIAEHILDLALLDTGNISDERRKAFIKRTAQFLSEQ